MGGALRWRKVFAVLVTCLMLLGIVGMVSGAPQTFTITSPTGNSAWCPGSTVTVTWTGGSSSTLVNLSLVDVPAWTVAAAIATAVPNTGSFTWTVPVGLPPGTYLVYIEDVGQTTWTYGPEFGVKPCDTAGKPDLTIDKREEGPLQAGQQGAYLLTVTNIGSGTAPGPITVTDYMGPGLTFIFASGAGWTCVPSGSTVVCTHPGPLPVASSLPQLVITVDVAKDAQKVENCASVSLEKPDAEADLANNRDCVGTVTVPPLTGSICGVKFEDKDGDGIQDPGEAGMVGWTIVLTDAAGNAIATVVTGTNGQYCFKGLALGSYVVSEVGQAGWTQTYPAQSGTYTIDLTIDKPDVKPVSFGNYPVKELGTICGVKFHDVNGNGTQGPGEPGLPGWTIQVLDGAGNVVATVTTGKDGRFCFKELKPGTYVFAEVQKPNWSQTAPAAPGTYTTAVMPGINMQMLVFGNRAKQDDPCCLTFRFPAGRADKFATSDGLEAASPSAAFAASVPSSLSALFDGTQMDRYFAHTFVLPQGNCIGSARLDVFAKPLGAGGTVQNDSISLRFTGVAGAQTWTSHFGSGQPNPGLLPNPWKLPTYGAGQLFSLDLGNLPGGGNLLTDLNAQRFLDIGIQDDTAVDYMVLTVEFCECQMQPDKTDKVTPAETRKP